MEFKKFCTHDGYALYGLENCRFLTTAVHEECLALEKSWEYPGVYVFVEGGADDKTFAADLSQYWQRAGEGLTFLWLQKPVFHSVHALFSRPDTRGCTRLWGLDFSGYGMAVPQGTVLGCDSRGFTLDGRVSLYGAGTSLLGKDAVIRTDGVIEFTVRHEGGFDLAAALDTGIKFSFDHIFEDEDEARRNGFLLTVSNHVIRAENAMSLQVRFELVKERLELYLPENYMFESHFTAISGRNLSLKSLAGARWTLARTAEHLHDGDYLRMRYYLTLAGSFEPQFSGCDRTILPGLSGTEYFDFSGIMSPVLTFDPDRDAYLGKINETSHRPTAAWVCYPADAAYYSQPGAAPLFAPMDALPDAAPADDGTALVFFSMPLLKLESSISVPQVFYKGCDNLITEDIENAVYTERFRLLSGSIKVFDGEREGEQAAETRAVSPQGLMVGVRSDSWVWISLANVGTKEAERLLLFRNIDLKLRREFAHIDMNLIYDHAAELLPYVGTSDPFAFSMDDMWIFDIHPAHWDDTSMLIIKYGTDLTIRSLAEGKAAFRHALDAVYDADGRISDEFIEFMEVIDDAEFTGVLALGVRLSVNTERMEKSLKTVWMGISQADRSAMRAHHLILRHTRVVQEGGGVSQRAASVDAVVAYRTVKGISYGSEYQAKDYDYQTTALTLCCRNSRLLRLVTESELLINTIAGSRCSKEDGNCLILDGRAFMDSGIAGFSFVLRNEGYYTMQSPLEGVKITNVSLAGDGGFSLDGSFYFVHDKQSDLFSFGLDGEKDNGLSFMGWKLNRVSDGVFSAGYGDIILTRSQPRNNSWMDRFPVEVDVFCYDMLHLPSWHGYSDVRTTLHQMKLSVPWYGVRYRVPLGSLGDLSENSVMDLHFLIAWSGGDMPGLYVGVRLPGGGGIDVQGLVKLGFDMVSLEALPEKGLESGRIRYRISLKQFTARFLWASFPPGRNEIVIEADESGKKLGWFGEYRDTESGCGND